MNHETIARIAHEVNREWCAYNGDLSQPRWDDAPEWQRSSAINGVAFHAANPTAGDSASHNSWLNEKIVAGWVYGPEKNPDTSPPTHPCIVAFDQLPREQQFKDRLFRTIVHAGLHEQAQIVAIKDAGAAFLAAIDDNCPPGREAAIAKTNAQQAVIWAVNGLTG